MTADELKDLPKGQFIVMKTGAHPMQTRLRLFLDWGKEGVSGSGQGCSQGGLCQQEGADERHSKKAPARKKGFASGPRQRIPTHQR